MTKSERGKVIKKIPNWRGTCPICHRTRVKIIWERTLEDGTKVKVCKVCKNKM